MVTTAPDRGDIISIQLNPQMGREQAGRRPALVLSPRLYNAKVGLTIVCPITKQVKGFPFEVSLPLTAKTQGVVLSDHVKSVDWRTREARFIERVSAPLLNEVLVKLGLLIGEH